VLFSVEESDTPVTVDYADPVNDVTSANSLGTVTVPGNANPITPGSEIGQACGADPDFICGELSGQATMPIM
jgi:hypothetical protein